MNQLLIINGPNLNYLGVRETGFYGKETWNDIEKNLKLQAEAAYIQLRIFQSNHEGAIVDFIQANMFNAAGAIINPAGHSKTGFAILDALLIKPLPFIEVHLSNIYARGGWHADSIFSAHAIGCIAGLHGMVYELAIHAFSKKLH